MGNGAKYLLIGCGSLSVLGFLFLVAVFVALVASNDTGSETGEATTERPREDTTDGAKRAQPTRASDEKEATSAPRPLTPEQALRRRIKTSTGLPKEITALKIQGSAEKCFNVSVDFTAEGFRSGGYVSAAEDNMLWIYEAAYKSGNPPVCNVDASAYTVFLDDYGNESRERVYSTEMDGTTGAKINWNNVYSVDASSLWTKTFVSPAFKQQRLQNQVNEAADCADDGGLFDMDMLNCP